MKHWRYLALAALVAFAAAETTAVGTTPQLTDVAEATAFAPGHVDNIVAGVPVDVAAFTHEASNVASSAAMLVTHHTFTGPQSANNSIYDMAAVSAESIIITVKNGAYTKEVHKSTATTTASAVVNKSSNGPGANLRL